MKRSSFYKGLAIFFLINGAVAWVLGMDVDPPFILFAVTASASEILEKLEGKP